MLFLEIITFHLKISAFSSIFKHKEDRNYNEILRFFIKIIDLFNSKIILFNSHFFCIFVVKLKNITHLQSFR